MGSARSSRGVSFLSTGLLAKKRPFCPLLVPRPVYLPSGASLAHIVTSSLVCCDINDLVHVAVRARPLEAPTARFDSRAHRDILRGGVTLTTSCT